MDTPVDGIAIETTASAERSASADRLTAESDGTESSGSDRPRLVTDGGENVKSRREVRNELVRTYSADGSLYAYRDGDEHVVVSKGQEPQTRWTKRVPAERTAVLAGEQRWTVPDNWEKLLHLNLSDGHNEAVYSIPETGVDVQLKYFTTDYLIDAWYTIKRVGRMEVNYDDDCDWTQLERGLDRWRERDIVSDEVVAALEQLLDRSTTVERKVEERVNMYARQIIFDYNTPAKIRNGRACESYEYFGYEDIIQDILDVSEETFDRVMEKLSDASVLPSYPDLRPVVQKREELPEGYDLQALAEVGCTADEIVDYCMIEFNEKSVEEWADTRGVDEQTVQKNVNKAQRKQSV